MTTAAAPIPAAAPAAAETPTAAGATPPAAQPPAEGTGAAPAKPIAKEFSILARKEQQLQRAREQAKTEAKTREDALARREAEIARREAEVQRLAEKPKSPREALERFGWDLKTANELALNDDNPTAEMIARQAAEETAALRRQIEEDKKKAADGDAARLKADEEAAIEGFKKECHDFAAQHADDYELIVLYEAQDTIFEAIELAYKQTGKILSVKEAADATEAYLADQVAKAKATRKFRAQQGSPQPAQDGGTPSKSEKSDQATTQQKTITNEFTSSTPTLVRTSHAEEDAFKRALRKLEGG